MGLVIVVVSPAVLQLSLLATVLVIVGGTVNPATFIPMVFSKDVASTTTFQAVSFISFTAPSVGLILAVVQRAATWQSEMAGPRIRRGPPR